MRMYKPFEQKDDEFEGGGWSDAISRKNTFCFTRRMHDVTLTDHRFDEDFHSRLLPLLVAIAIFHHLMFFFYPLCCRNKSTLGSVPIRPKNQPEGFAPSSEKFSSHFNVRKDTMAGV